MNQQLCHAILKNEPTLPSSSLEPSNVQNKISYYASYISKKSSIWQLRRKENTKSKAKHEERILDLLLSNRLIYI